MSTSTTSSTHNVTTVAGRDPALLAQFLGDTSFTVELDGAQHLVSGTGLTLHEREVLFEEHDQVLDELHSWRVRQEGSGFAAEPVDEG